MMRVQGGYTMARDQGLAALNEKIATVGRVCCPDAAVIPGMEPACRWRILLLLAFHELDVHRIFCSRAPTLSVCIEIRRMCLRACTKC